MIFPPKNFFCRKLARNLPAKASLTRDLQEKCLSWEKFAIKCKPCKISCEILHEECIRVQDNLAILLPEKNFQSPMVATMRKLDRILKMQKKIIRIMFFLKFRGSTFDIFPNSFSRLLNYVSNISWSFLQNLKITHSQKKVLTS